MNIVKKSSEIAEIDGKYIITRNGDVFRWHRTHGKWEKQKKRVHNNGYLRGTISGKDVYIHRLVAEAFCENPRGCKEVNHKDGNKQNNNADNLEWCTRSENNRHAFQTGLRDYKELKRMSEKAQVVKRQKRRLTDDQVKEIRERKEKGTPSHVIAKEYGMVRQTIDAIWHRRMYRDVG